MPVPSAITDLSQTAGSNYPAGSESPNTADDYFRAHASFIAMLRDGIGFTDPVALASAATTSIGAQNSQFVEITGVTGITSFGTTYNGPRFLRFTGILTLTHSSSLNLPTSANITTAAGDTAIAIPNSAGNGWDVVSFYRKDGSTLGTAASATHLAGGSAGTEPYQSAAGTTAMLAAGTAGQFKTSGGAGAPTWTTAATTGEVQTGTDTAKPVTASSMQNGKIVLAASQATTSGTSKDFTGLPSWAKSHKLMATGFSHNGSSTIIVQLGDSGGFETGGYTGAVARITNAASPTTWNINAYSGFVVAVDVVATDVFNLEIDLTLKNASTNEWVAKISSARTDATVVFTGQGAKALTDVLTQIRFTTEGSSDTMDAGSVSLISY